MKLISEYIFILVFLVVLTIVPFLVDKYFLGNLTGYVHLFYYICSTSLMWIIVQKSFLERLQEDKN